MKALIRNRGETVTEADGIPGINWTNGMPLTCPDWAGGPYILVNDYVPDDPANDFAEDPECTPAATPEASQDPVIDNVQDTIVIDGVTYTRTS